MQVFIYYFYPLPLDEYYLIGIKNSGIYSPSYAYQYNSTIFETVGAFTISSLNAAINSTALTSNAYFLPLRIYACSIFVSSYCNLTDANYGLSTGAITTLPPISTGAVTTQAPITSSRITTQRVTSGSVTTSRAPVTTQRATSAVMTTRGVTSGPISTSIAPATTSITPVTSLQVTSSPITTHSVTSGQVTTGQRVTTGEVTTSQMSGYSAFVTTEVPATGSPIIKDDDNTSAKVGAGVGTALAILVIGAIAGISSVDFQSLIKKY